MLPADFWRLAGPEPDLHELMDDPLVRALMRGDKVAPKDLSARMREASRRLAERRDAGTGPKKAA